MQTVILCGGLGTRLREETEYRPKPMVEIGGRPILWHIMKSYAVHGYAEFIVCLGYKGERIKEYFLNYQPMNNDFTIQLGANQMQLHDEHDEGSWRVTLTDTGLQTMTGARLKRASRYLTGDRFMLTYGDGVADVDVRALVAFHERCGTIGAVTGVRPSSRFGELLTDGQQRVMQFSEKPRTHAGLINGGFFVFRREFLDYLSADGDCVLEGEPLERLAAEGQLSVYQHDGFWQCMDTYRDHQLLNQLWSSGQAPWKKW